MRAFAKFADFMRWLYVAAALLFVTSCIIASFLPLVGVK